MSVQNPFFIRNTEKIDADSSFLSMFNAKPLSYIRPEDIQKTVFFRSTPGAGKSSIFRLLSPGVLKEVIVNDNQRNTDTKKFLESINAIENGSINILGVQISCAENYSLIDDLYTNGRRTQFFLALINLRIIRSALKNVMVLHNLQEKDLGKITFKDIPSEILGCIEYGWTGYDLYRWAIEKENEISYAFDDFGGNYKIPFALSSLSVLPLINADNLMYEGNTFIKYTLLMIDDLQWLTKRQYIELREQIFKRKGVIGIWLAERLSILDDKEILGTTAKLARDYEEYILEEEIDQTGNKFLEDIADRRIRMIHEFESFGNYSSCLDDSLQIESKVIDAVNERYMNELFDQGHNNDIYAFYKRKYGDVDIDSLIFLRALKILTARNENQMQISLYSTTHIDNNDVFRPDDSLSPKISKLLPIAKYYLSVENKIPFYYGMEKISTLSSANIEQFLEFAGYIFDRRMANNYVKNKQTKRVTPQEQEEIIKKNSKILWDSIQKQYTNASDIYRLLDNICEFGVKTRDKGLASYSGGAYTGIGISTDIYYQLINDDSNNSIVRALANSVASNYLMVRDVKQGKPDEHKKVFYLNRWICVLYGLPLAYGGWKPISRKLFTHLLDENPITDDESDVNISFFDD